MKKPSDILWGPSPFASSIREVAALLEAEGYTRRVLRNMSPEKLRDLVEKHSPNMPEVDADPDYVRRTNRTVR